MIKAIVDFFSNVYVWAAVISWLVAQTIKIIIGIFKNGKADFKLFGSTGGMPSAHSATISGITFAIGKFVGFSSAPFALSFVMAIIVITDALHLRREVGRHATVLEQMTKKHFDTKSGHSITEVIAGVIIGMFVGLLL
uniref:Divergent PAP2 family protein n=1 Tax=Mesoaciditoga lauensis TaxID=1495039 RepID=A0A7V3RDG8_9BACT